MVHQGDGGVHMWQGCPVDSTPGLAKGGDELAHQLAAVHTEDPLPTATTTTGACTAESYGELVHRV